MMSGIHKERTAAMEIGRYFCNDPAAPKPNSPTHIGTNVLLEAEGGFCWKSAGTAANGG